MLTHCLHLHKPQKLPANMFNRENNYRNVECKWRNTANMQLLIPNCARICLSATMFGFRKHAGKH